MQLFRYYQRQHLLNFSGFTDSSVTLTYHMLLQNVKQMLGLWHKAGIFRALMTYEPTSVYMYLQHIDFMGCYFNS